MVFPQVLEPVPIVAEYGLPCHAQQPIADAVDTAAEHEVEQQVVRLLP